MMTRKSILAVANGLLLLSLLFSSFTLLAHQKGTQLMRTDTLTLNFSPNTKFKIQRKVAHHEQYTQGNTVTELREITIKVQNILSKEMNIRVEELLPDVHQPSVELELMQHSHAEFDIEKSLLVWNLSLKPKQMVNLAVKFKVVYQKGTPKLPL